MSGSERAGGSTDALFASGGPLLLEKSEQVVNASWAAQPALNPNGADQILVEQVRARS